MSRKLKVISGIHSKADQYSVLVSPLEHIGNSYICITHNGTSLTVGVEADTKIPLGHISIHPYTHARYLKAAHGDIVTWTIDTVQPVENIQVQLKPSGQIVKNPFLPKPIYVEPGYYLKVSNGIAIVISGSGLYTSRLSEIETISDLLDKTVDAPVDAINVDFCKLGIGGLKSQLDTLIRQVLISRIVDEDMRAKYHVKDIKGILLHGPPGTGKTLIARKIGDIIPNSKIIQVSGPELSSKYYGETEGNIRGIFDKCKAEPKKLHIIIFDEIDAIGRRRGEGSGHIDDKVLTQLLTMIDGLSSANNILIIGITNRKDVLDDALIRAGRIECHVEIPLPTEEGRREILDIYIRPLIKDGTSEAIDIDSWAARLDGYSGADIESLIGRAKNLALIGNCEIVDNNIKLADKGSLNKLDNNHILMAFENFNPTFSRKDDLLSRYLTHYELTLTDLYNHHLSSIRLALTVKMKDPYVLNLGLASLEVRILACYLADSLKLQYIKYLSYNDFLGKTSAQNCSLLEGYYHKCLQAERAVLILDCLSHVNDNALNLRQHWICESPLPIDKQLVIIMLT